MAHLEESQAAAGEHLTVQGEACYSIFFITVGQATLQLELENGETVRLRTVGPGSVIGVEGMLHPHVHHHAEPVVTDEVSTYYRLSSEALGRLK